MSADRFSRIRPLVGEAGLARLQAARVAVVGLGAVGSYAVEALARAGIGRLRLVDFDVIRPSNLNRQLFALETTVGERKTAVAAARVRSINAACEVDCLDLFVTDETLPAVLAGELDLLVDAIDALNPKIKLLAAARSRELPLVASMGAALRCDPTAIRVGPLAESQICPLARRVRQGLRRRGVPCDFTCVWSIEPVVQRYAEPGEEPVHQPVGREPKTLGSLPTLTGMFGLAAAHAALAALLDRPATGGWPEP